MPNAANAAAALENLVQTGSPESDIFVTMADLARTAFRYDFTSHGALWQFGAVALAILVAQLLTGRWGRRALEIRSGISKDSLVSRLQRFLLAMIANTLFSLVAAASMYCFVYVLVETGIVLESQTRVARLAYSVFLAWAMLRCMLMFFAGMIGERYVGARVRRIFTIVFWTLAVLQFVGVLPVVIAQLKSISLPIGSGRLTLWGAVIGIFTVFLALCIANWLSNVSEAAIMQAEGVERNLRTVFSRICRVLFMVLAVLVSLTAVGIDLTVLSVFGGAIGVGIGFGMQKIASNYISGFIILLDRSIKIGDM
ncbi:MAG: mechanosensitive ion channel, partial [Duodenibacillus sp.]|nr:mechanosensitive ion channel [Duodenibacillus sp.]